MIVPVKKKRGVALSINQKCFNALHSATRALADLEDHDVVTITLDDPGLDPSAVLPAGAPPEAWLHSAIHHARPDAGGIVRAQPRTAFAATAALHHEPRLDAGEAIVHLSMTMTVSRRLTH